jgi:hypothetical protein
LDSLRADHDEAHEHLQQAYDKGFVVEAVKFRPRPTREARRSEKRPEDSGSEDIEKEQKRRKRKMKKNKKKKSDFNETDDDDDEAVSSKGMSEENMRMILDELKETRRDNANFQNLLKTQIKDNVANEMNQISRNLSVLVLVA